MILFPIGFSNFISLYLYHTAKLCGWLIRKKEWPISPILQFGQEKLNSATTILPWGVFSRWRFFASFILFRVNDFLFFATVIGKRYANSSPLLPLKRFLWFLRMKMPPIRSSAGVRFSLDVDPVHTYVYLGFIYVWVRLCRFSILKLGVNVTWTAQRCCPIPLFVNGIDAQASLAFFRN